MADTTADQVAAFLDDVRKRWEVWGEAESLPVLVAALEAVMRFHVPRESDDGTRFCVFCSCAEGEEVVSPCPEVQAITSELLGKEERRG